MSSEESEISYILPRLGIESAEEHRERAFVRDKVKDSDIFDEETLRDSMLDSADFILFK